MASSSRSRLPSSVTRHVVAGRPWTARHIHNTHLRYHCRQLGRTFQKPASTQALPLRGACLRLVEGLECASDVFTRQMPKRRNIVPALLRIAAYQQHWIRGPESWKSQPDHGPREQFHDLIRHLFTCYAMPGFYLNAWYATGGLEHVDRDWFCQVARGGYIRRLPGVPAGLTKRAAHLMAGAPDHFSIRQAMRFGQLRALELPETFIDLVLRQPMATNFGADGIWLPFFMMVARDGSLDAEEFLSVLHYLHAEIRDPKLRRVSLKERSLRELLRSAERSLRDMLVLARQNGIEYSEADLERPEVRAHLRSLAATIWPPMDLVAPFEIENRGRWRIVELCSQRDLQFEGRELEHCVASYGSKCLAGKSAIFSLRRWEEDDQYWDPWLTIEVDTRNRHIVQMRSVWNHDPVPRELDMVRAWCKARDIKLDS